MQPELRQLLIDWLELGEPGHPVLPDNLYALRERTRAALLLPNNATGYGPGLIARAGEGRKVPFADIMKPER